MPNTLGLILFVVFIVAAILLGGKIKLNSGLVAIALAFIFGSFYGLSTSKIVNLFPSRILMVYLLACFFYGFANENGLMVNLSSQLVYATRKFPKLTVILLLVVTWLVSTLGAGAEATPVIMAPLLYSLSSSMGFDPILCVIIVYMSSTGTQMPWAAQFNNNVGMNESIWATHQEAVAGGMANALLQIAVSLVVFFAFYFITKAYKVNIPKDMARPAPLDKKQRLTLWVIVIVVVLLILPGALKLFVGSTPFVQKFSSLCDIRMLTALGAIVLSICNCANPKEVFAKRIPWGIIILVCGMMTLVSVGREVGVVDYISTLLGTGSNSVLICIIICAVGVVMSFVVSGTAVVSLITALCGPLATSFGVPGYAFYAAGTLGLFASGISPYSTGGAMALLGCPDELKDKMMKKEIMLAAIYAVLMILVVALDLQTKIGNLFM